MSRRGVARDTAMPRPQGGSGPPPPSEETSVDAPAGAATRESASTPGRSPASQGASRSGRAASREAAGTPRTSLSVTPSSSDPTTRQSSSAPDDDQLRAVVGAILDERLDTQMDRLRGVISDAIASRIPEPVHLAGDQPSVAPASSVPRVAAPAGSPDPGGDPPDFDDDPFGFPDDSAAPPPRRDPARDPRRDSVDKLVDTLGESDLSKMWNRDLKLAAPRFGGNINWPPKEGKFILRKPPRGRPVTARLFLDFYKEHLIMLSQVSYPLAYYIEEEMKSFIETFYKEENLRFLPEDIQAQGIKTLANLDNRSLIYVAQLSIRPISREKWLEALWNCSRPPKPDSRDAFIDQAIHYNYNMALLNAIHENIDYLNLNGGYKHMPSLDWKQDKDRYGPTGNKQAIGLARVISEMLSGTLATRIVIHFRPRSLEEETESQVNPAPNFGRPNDPKTVAELLAAYRSIYSYYYLFAEGIK